MILTIYQHEVNEMTRLSTTYAANRGFRDSYVAIFFQLMAIVVLVASSATAQTRFSATPIAPGRQFSTTAQQKQEALAKGAQHPAAVHAEAVNPPHVAAACSPEIFIAPGMSPAG